VLDFFYGSCRGIFLALTWLEIRLATRKKSYVRSQIPQQNINSYQFQCGFGNMGLAGGWGVFERVMREKIPQTGPAKRITYVQIIR